MYCRECSQLTRSLVLVKKYCATLSSTQFYCHQKLSSCPWVCRVLALWFLVCSIAVIAVASPQAGATPADAAKPARQIDLSKLGYQGLSAENRFMTTANVTVNFLDNNHLLFTWNPKRLFQRNPDCPPSHQDRIVQARVVEVETGKVIREASWYLHDESRALS